VSTEGGELSCTASIVIQAEGSQTVTKTSTVVHKSSTTSGGDDGETVITKTSSSSSSHSSSSHSVMQTGSGRQSSRTSQQTSSKSFGLIGQYNKGAPNIDKFPKSQFAGIGSSATFSCHITCDPPPKVTWSRDGVPLTESESISFSAVDGQYSLTVKDINKDSGGDFTIVAANDFGELSCTASLFVTGESLEIVEGDDESVEEYESEEGAESDDESE